MLIKMNVFKLFLVFFVMINLADIGCFPTKNEKGGTSLRHKKKPSEKRSKLNHKLFKDHHKRPKRHPAPTDLVSRHHETLKCLRQYLSSQRKRAPVYRPYFQSPHLQAELHNPVRYWPSYYPQTQKTEWNLERQDENQPLRSIPHSYKYSGEVEISQPEKIKKEKSHNHVLKTHHDHEAIRKQIESIRNKTNAHIAAVKDRTNSQIAAVRNKTNSHIAAVRNITNSQIAAIRDTTKVQIDAVRNKTNAHLDAKKNYLQNVINRVPQIQVHVEAGIKKHSGGNHGVALDISNNGVKLQTGPIINENSQRRSDLITTAAEPKLQSTESSIDILATVSPKTTPLIEVKFQEETERSNIIIENTSESLKTWNIFSPVLEEDDSVVDKETSTLASGFHSLNISKPSIKSEYEVHEIIEEGNNDIFRDDPTTEKSFINDEKISTEGSVRNDIEQDLLQEVSTESVNQENLQDDIRNVPEESEKKVTFAAMINDEMSEADVESKLNFDSKKQVTSTEFVEKLLEKLYTTPADDFIASIWESEKINHDDHFKSIDDGNESDFKSETTELPKEMENIKLEERFTTENEKSLRDYTEEETTNGKSMEPKAIEEYAYTTESLLRKIDPTEHFYKEVSADELRTVDEATTNLPEMKMLEETSEAFRNEEVTEMIDAQPRNEETTAVMYDDAEQNLKQERKLHHQQHLDSNDIGNQYFLITEAGDLTPFTEKAIQLFFEDNFMKEAVSRNEEQTAQESPELPTSSNDENNHIFFIDQNGKNLTSLSQIRSESTTEKRRSDILITDEYNELPDANEDETSSFTNLTVFSLNPEVNFTTYQEPPETFSPESLLQLIPVIIHELRANKSVTPEDMKVFSDLYGKLWPAIEQISKNPEINITQLLNIKSEEDLQNLMSLFAKLQEMQEDKLEDLEGAETSSHAFSTIRYEEPSLYDYVDDHQEESYEPPEEIIDEKEVELENEKEFSEFNARSMDTDDFSTGFQDSYNDYVAEESLPESFSDPQDYIINEELGEVLEEQESDPSVLELFQTAQAHESFRNVRLPSSEANYPFSEDNENLYL